MQHLSQQMVRAQKQNVHEAIRQTLERRRELFEQFHPSFTDSVPHVHLQLQQTIREHKATMQQVYRHMQSLTSKKAA
jgi:hypothetical protein